MDSGTRQQGVTGVRRRRRTSRNPGWGLRPHESLASWDVPDTALQQWLALALALVELGERTLACERDPEAWFESGQFQFAKAGCAECPVLDECRAYGLAAEEKSGVWGGTTAAERRRHAIRTAGPV